MRWAMWLLVIAAVASAGCSSGGSSSSGSTSGTSTSGGTTTSGTTGASTSGGTTTSGTTGSAPGAFTVTSPANGSSRQPLTPTLVWNAADGAGSYTVEVASSASFGASVVFSETGVTGTQLDVPSSAGLKPGVIYAWRVTAVNPAGSTVASNAPQRFSSPYQVLGAHGIGVTPDGSTLVVSSDVNNGPIELIDLGTGAITAVATGVASQPKGVAVSSDGTQALATLLTNGSGGINGVAIVDVAHKSLVGTVSDPCVGTTLTDVAYLGSTSQAAMPDLSGGCTQMGLTTFTASTGTPNFAFVNFNDTNDPWGVAVTPDGSKAVVTMELGNKVYEVTLPSAVSAIDVGDATAGAAITPDGTQAVVATGSGVTVLDLATGAVVAPISFSSIPDVPTGDFHNVAITPDGSTAVVAASQNLVLVSLSTHALSTYPLSGGQNVVVSPQGDRAYVTDPGDGWVRVVQVP